MAAVDCLGVEVTLVVPEYVHTMARYNSWQNTSLYNAAAALPDGERHQDRGAFFKSIHATLNHLLWGDQTWLSRFAGTLQPAVGLDGSTTLHADFTLLRAERERLDEMIVDWAGGVTPAWLAHDFTWYSASAGRELTYPAGLIVVHFFNHQTHHRGQVHAMLTQAGAVPEATDLFLMLRESRGKN